MLSLTFMNQPIRLYIQHQFMLNSLYRVKIHFGESKQGLLPLSVFWAPCVLLGRFSFTPGPYPKQKVKKNPSEVGKRKSLPALQGHENQFPQRFPLYYCLGENPKCGGFRLISLLMTTGAQLVTCSNPTPLHSIQN